MKREWKAALGIGGIVLVAALAGLGVFLFSSELGIWFIGIGIPVLLIAGVGLYVRGVVSRSGGSRTEYTRSQARQAGEAAREFLVRYEELRAEHPDWDHAGIEEELDQVLADLADQGVSVDPEAGSYSLTGLGGADVQELDRLHDSVQGLDDRLQSEFEGYVRSRLNDLEADLDRLADADLAEPSAWQGPPSRGAELATLESTLDRHVEEAKETVSRAADAVEELLADADRRVDRERVREHLETARDDARGGKIEWAVDAVLDARRTIETDLSGEFERLQEDVVGLAETVESSVAAEYVAGPTMDEVADCRRRAAGLDSGLDMRELREADEELREVCVGIVEEMADDLADDVATLEAADVPEGYWERPAAADDDHVENLRLTESVEEFRRVWIDAVGSLSSALDSVSTEASVARSYPEMEAEIEETLRAAGEVGPDDLPVRQPAAFLELYARTHPDASYDAARETLTAGGGGESHDLTVTARFESGGEERAATVAVEGQRTDRARVETHLAEEVTFEDLPYGEYEVSATPDADGFSAASETVTLDGDASLALEMAEVTLRDRLCEGVEDRMRDHLPELADDLAADFESTGYLSTAMDYPVAAEYVPCLLALYADREGLALTEAGGEVLAYDDDRLAGEVETVAEYNLDPGGEMSFEELRTSFLTASLPDEALARAVADAGVADVSVEGTVIRKPAADAGEES